MPTSEQEALYANLIRRSPKLARIYRGGLLVLADEENPCRYELAAHSIREIMEKCPLLAGAAPLGSGDSMPNRLNNVRIAYHTATRGHGIGAVLISGASEGAILTLVGELGKFFEWQDENRLQARKRIAQTLAALSGPVLALPADIAEGEVNGWMEADSYLKKTAHHGHDNVIPQEFLRGLLGADLVGWLHGREVEEQHHQTAVAIAELAGLGR